MKKPNIRDPAIENKRFRRVMEREFTAFFELALLSPLRGWPPVTEQVLADAIADSLIALGKKRGFETALLQTLVYELQDRINHQQETK